MKRYITDSPRTCFVLVSSSFLHTIWGYIRRIYSLFIRHCSRYQSRVDVLRLEDRSLVLILTEFGASRRSGTVAVRNTERSFKSLTLNTRLITNHVKWDTWTILILNNMHSSIVTLQVVAKIYWYYSIKLSTTSTRTACCHHIVMEPSNKSSGRQTVHQNISLQSSRPRSYPCYPPLTQTSAIQFEPLRVVRQQSQETIDYCNEGIRLQPKWRQYGTSGVVFIISCIWILSVISFAFMSSSSNPVIIFPKPQTTINIINFGTSVSVFLLGELWSGAFDSLRWTLASRNSGFSMASFLGLSRATSNFGVWKLLFHDFQVGHRKWCAQRYWVV